ncbi:undecaprenyldiphospho-muramoylpentapeptide beta-N-acetylglucosaminyltransferase [Tsukamurella sp. 8F]|uniref:undecaprenyldiphospho-muramoylpentapeptide beta-N-acetylglucosaminyltransferase n=1 Tax=unclassified Tsukamurella TaxID=2633480 RepID=UPI0023B9D71D|nr:MULTISPECIES: undecaprenyldiphospho-muramoylpentapeptide beta-N-acetylglucosaminyltransferase [unclassified Tsukamurella]MDF0532463.1 undecaprenyldiphospho-muramoylpentapeptide beta-N-acetylglucosaminyltransferase [Tsukamurella sp. 8J]MDF0588446.1 undecaprenyldiphospho-muramoylpentapeptide beta-N-acetylglucosaminyltransferase [Tsukamurella sp. 8F]
MSTPTRPASVVVAGGGTAGHIEPAMAVADAVQRIDPDARITALGTPKGLEGRLVPERGYRLEMIPPVPLPRKPGRDLLELPARVVGAVRRTRQVLREVEADVVVGFGGYVALPAYLAARSLRLPVVIHEANARAGVANKVGARLATEVFAAVPDSGIRGRVVGMPVREAITSLDRRGLRAEARAHFGLPGDGPVVLVFGGSQGALRLNEGISGAAPELASAGVGVLHAYGPKNTLDVSEPGYVAVPYLTRMDLAYAAADLAVCRSGAMTVAEVASVGLPAVYVPLPHGNGEQALNARPVVDAGGGIMVADSDFTPGYVRDTVAPLALDGDRLAAMGTAAAGCGHRDAAGTVAAAALDLARR